MNKEQQTIYEQGLEQYSIGTIVTENVFMALWLAIGAYLCWLLMPLIGWIYLGFGLTMVLFVMRILVCGKCYYHGKRCHTGWGKLSALYCKQGDVKDFGKGISGAIIPLFYGLMALIPLVTGIIATIKNFTFITLVVIVVFLFVVVMSSFTLRKKSCAQCKMKHLCPGCAAK